MCIHICLNAFSCAARERSFKPAVCVLCLRVGQLLLCVEIWMQCVLAFWFGLLLWHYLLDQWASATETNSSYEITLRSTTPTPIGGCQFNLTNYTGTCITLDSIWMHAQGADQYIHIYSFVKSICCGKNSFMQLSMFIPLLQSDTDNYYIFSLMYKHSDTVTFLC